MVERVIGVEIEVELDTFAQRNRLTDACVKVDHARPVELIPPKASEGEVCRRSKGRRIEPLRKGFGVFDAADHIRPLASSRQTEGVVVHANIEGSSRLQGYHTRNLPSAESGP